MSGTREPGRRGPACPICGKPVDKGFKPFCSRRCKDVDLSRWFGESYRIPAVDDDLADTSPSEDD